MTRDRMRLWWRRAQFSEKLLRAGRQIDADEALEDLWTIEEREQAATVTQFKPRHAREWENLLERKLISVKDDQIELTAPGRERARTIIRCHRLAERLLSDVLAVGGGTMEEQACDFEHSLSEEVANSICTLLGHPHQCPHGRLIPPGECCRREQRAAAPVVLPLDQLPIGHSGRIAYIATTSHRRLDRLSGLGLVPGRLIHLHQRSPAFVIQAGGSDVALDKETAQEIFVRPRGEEGK